MLPSDQRRAWDLQPSGSYVQREPPADERQGGLGSQQVLMDLTRERVAAKGRAARR